MAYIDLDESLWGDLRLKYQSNFSTNEQNLINNIYQYETVK